MKNLIIAILILIAFKGISQSHNHNIPNSNQNNHTAKASSEILDFETISIIGLWDINGIDTVEFEIEPLTIAGIPVIDTYVSWNNYYFNGLKIPFTFVIDNDYEDGYLELVIYLEDSDTDIVGFLKQVEDDLFQFFPYE